MTTQYFQVKTTNFAELAQEADASEKNSKKAKDQANNAWAGVVRRALDDGWLERANPHDEVKEIQQQLQGMNFDTLKTDIQDAGLLPKSMKGISRKTGKTFDLLNNKGEVRWSEWRATRMLTMYPGILAKVLKAGIVDELQDTDGNIIGKSAIESRATEILKPKKSPLELFKQFLDSSAGQYEHMNPQERIEADVLLKSFAINLEEMDKRA